jgi:hypothetical protein
VCLAGIIRDGCLDSAVSDTHGTPYVHDRQTHLQRDQSVSMVSDAPKDPQDIAHQKAPETPIALEALLGTDQPGGKDGQRHRRPLQVPEGSHGTGMHQRVRRGWLDVVMEVHDPM